MSNLPIQFTDKVNSAELLAIMQQFGEHTYVDAELINKLRDALNELHARTADTRIVENTGLEIVGTDIIINELWKWLILSVLYTNNSEITIPITLSTEGKQKLCYLCANQENGFELVYGPESDTNPSAPTIENNLLPVTFFLVTDGTVGTPAEPIVGNVYKKKSESLGYGDPYLSGTNAVIQLRPEGNSRYAFSNPGLISIDGFGLSLISGNPSAEVPYDGKDLFVENTGTTPITLLHDGAGTANSKFFFLDETDLIIPPAGKVCLKYGNSYSELLFKNWDNTKLDKSTTPDSVYTTDASGNQEMIPKSSFRQTFNQSTWSFSDFYYDNLLQPPFIGAAISGGSRTNGTFSDSGSDYTGCHILMSGTTANGGYRFTDTSNPIYTGLRSRKGLTFFGIFKLMSNSDARDRQIRIGFHSSTTSTAQANGVYLEILGSEASFKARDLNVESSSASVTLSSNGISSPGDDYKVLIEYIDNYEVRCKLIDYFGVVVLDVTHTTNVPVNGRRFGCGLTATITTAGANHQIMTIDYMGIGREKPNFLNEF
ncbi:hypothetical protein GFJ99_11755 [Flavobacterium sp. LMO6]|uniref:SO2946-like C-terminal domain-containing protein n=1 Tax=Flavobacterium phage vB_FspS_laban6-1 TaxID=2686250 RepID=A0A6B9LAQ4_9CAUD|nr:hypothetical protein [Flavobacterium sp. LMO6]YP_009854843.1 hypothetical protein HWC90_gp45 [Flavobacterium phage vB_FspS_laban6-1]MQP63370.1 hypothetical protein [Flavobacterium sp. LMO6]QHB39016.1 hypothetical protein laban61_gp045 [Flavobacterium phage vB_FspS_laban6-1]